MANRNMDPNSKTDPNRNTSPKRKADPNRKKASARRTDPNRKTDPNKKTDARRRSGSASRAGAAGIASAKVRPQNPGSVQKKRANEMKAQRKKINRYIRISGRVAFVLQVIVSLVMLFTVARSGMLPWKYIVLMFLALTALAAATLLMNLRRNRKVRIGGIGISTVVIIVVLVFNSYFNRTMGLISGGEKALKTDNMIVVVRADDPAGDLADAKDYTFGVHSPAGETGGSKAMIEDIEKVLSSKIKTREYGSDIEVARALMDGEVDAAIYNKAYTSIIAESLENDEYEDQVKVLHQYGVQTDIAEESVEVGEPFNVLISGIDVYGDISQTSRSDVNIIVTVNPKTKRILLTSTPRDYYVEIPEISNGQKDKLTHAGIYGIDASMRTLENLYGIDITYFVRVNFDTLIKLVDAMDGLDVYVEYPFDCYTDEYHFDKGWHDMFGDQVLAFCRERYSFADGDNQRGRNQEQVLKALLEKMMSPAILPHYSEILDSLDGFFQLNMSQKKIAELVNMQLSDNAHWEILKQTASQGEGGLEPTYSGGSTPLYVMWPDDASVKTNAVRIEMIMHEGYGDADVSVAAAE